MEKFAEKFIKFAFIQICKVEEAGYQYEYNCGESESENCVVMIHNFGIAQKSHKLRILSDMIWNVCTNFLKEI